MKKYKRNFREGVTLKPSLSKGPHGAPSPKWSPYARCLEVSFCRFSPYAAIQNLSIYDNGWNRVNAIFSYLIHSTFVQIINGHITTRTGKPFTSSTVSSQSGHPAIKTTTFLLPDISITSPWAWGKFYSPHFRDLFFAYS